MEPSKEKRISPSDGPIAVTGASGYIGSWIVKDCLEQGYTVHACVRDKNKAEKIDHLQKIGQEEAGKLVLFEADLFKRGSYDDAFDGCCAVIHAGATVGYNKETPQEVYDGCFTENDHVIDSVKKSKNIKRFVFTSSFAAVGHPRPPGYIFTEADWCGDNPDGYKGKWTKDSIPENRDIAYAMAKANTEKLIYKVAEESGSFDAMAILPLHVIGPLMCANHDQGWSWQNCMKQMAQGKPYKKSKGGRMLWNNVDVRDVGKAHRLCAESLKAKNGSRYILSATDRSGELFTWELQSLMSRLFPEITSIGGEEMVDGKPLKPTYDSPRSYCTLAIEELGLKTHSIEETVKATIDSYLELDMI